MQNNINQSPVLSQLSDESRSTTSSKGPQRTTPSSQSWSSRANVFPPSTAVSSQAATNPSRSSTHPRQPSLSSAPSGDSQLNSRSCITCRRRKVRCNKRHPCSNCVKAGIECVFPGPGRAPRKSKKPLDNELLARLRRLEGVVQTLGAQVDEGGPAPTLPPQKGSADVGVKNTERDKNDTGAAQSESPCAGFINADPREMVPPSLNHEFGRLVIDEGRSRYVSNRFWASLGDEIEEMRDILNDYSSDEEDYPSPENSGSGSTQSSTSAAFLFGFHSLAHSLRKYHPSQTQVFVLWYTFQENVAPMAKMFHLPTTKRAFMDAVSSLDTLSKETEVFMFTIYYSAIVSMTAQQCQASLGEDRDTALDRYRFAVEQALARANFMSTQSITVLQAAVLFLGCVHGEADSRYAWSMASLIFRMAQAMGLHRDGIVFGLKPFETEMRRRLWWHICVLDLRSSEDHGCEPLVHEAFFDTRMPLNVNDEDITPGMEKAPEERIGATEMTFNLIRFEVIMAVRRISYFPSNPRCPSQMNGLTIEQREAMIEALNNRLQERYVQHCDMSVPMDWVSATVARLIISKLWLVVHHPMSRKDHGASLPLGTRDRLFLTSIEVIEFSSLLQNNVNTAKWSWLFRTYMQWHAVAFVLSEICSRPACPVTDRAWAAVSSMYDGWETKEKEKKGMLWRPMKKLMSKARRVREIQRQEMDNEFGRRLIGVDKALPPGNTSLPPGQPQVPASAADLPTTAALQQRARHPSATAAPNLNIDLYQSLPDFFFNILPQDQQDKSNRGGTDQHATSRPAPPAPMNSTGSPQIGGYDINQWLGTNALVASPDSDTNPFAAVNNNPGLFTDPSILWSGWDDMDADVPMENGPGNPMEWFESG